MNSVMARHRCGGYAADSAVCAPMAMDTVFGVLAAATCRGRKVSSQRASCRLWCQHEGVLLKWTAVVALRQVGLGGGDVALEAYELGHVP